LSVIEEKEKGRREKRERKEVLIRGVVPFSLMAEIDELTISSKKSLL
jgi:hypothetical protein